MNHSPAYILAQYLIGQDLLSDPIESAVGDWPVYVGALPDGEYAPNDAVGCMDTAPVKDGRPMGGAPLFHYGVQLLLRADDYTDGYAKVSACADALAAVDGNDVSIGSDTYRIQNVSQATGVVVVGQEEGTRRREMFSVNVLATIEEV